MNNCSQKLIVDIECQKDISEEESKAYCGQELIETKQEDANAQYIQNNIWYIQYKILYIILKVLVIIYLNIKM